MRTAGTQTPEPHTVWMAAPEQRVVNRTSKAPMEVTNATLFLTRTEERRSLLTTWMQQPTKARGFQSRTTVIRQLTNLWMLRGYQTQKHQADA